MNAALIGGLTGLFVVIVFTVFVIYPQIHDTQIDIEKLREKQIDKYMSWDCEKLEIAYEDVKDYIKRYQNLRDTYKEKCT